MVLVQGQPLLALPVLTRISSPSMAHVLLPPPALKIRLRTLQHRPVFSAIQIVRPVPAHLSVNAPLVHPAGPYLVMAAACLHAPKTSFGIQMQILAKAATVLVVVARVLDRLVVFHVRMPMILSSEPVHVLPLCMLVRAVRTPRRFSTHSVYVFRNSLRYLLRRIVYRPCPLLQESIDPSSLLKAGDSSGGRFC